MLKLNPHLCKSLRPLRRGFLVGCWQKGLVKATLLTMAAISVLPLGAYGGTNLNLRGTSSVYIDAYVNFITATTFELFQMMFSLVKLPNGDIGIGTNSLIKDLVNQEKLGQASGSSVAIKGVQGEIVQISCSKEGALSNGLQRMPISNVEVAAGKANTGDFGQGIACDGENMPILSHVLQGQGEENTLFIGVRLQVNDKLAATRYTTSAPQGQPVAFEINYI